jgi:hypothetical protein
VIDPPEAPNPAEEPRRAASRRFALPGGRRTLIASGVLVLCALVSGVALALAPAGTPRSPLVATVAPPTTAAPSATTVPTSTTEAPATTVATPPQTAVSSSRETAATTAPTTSTILVCHNSYNPACGAFRWDPAPASGGPAGVSITYSPSKPQPGDWVTFTVTVSDPDTTVSTCGQVAFGTGPDYGCSDQQASGSCPTRYGPWTPPAKTPSSATKTYSPVQYKSSGSYTFTAQYPIGTACYDPYEGTANGSVTFYVGNPPSPTAVAPG